MREDRAYAFLYKKGACTLLVVPQWNEVNVKTSLGLLNFFPQTASLPVGREKGRAYLSCRMWSNTFIGSTVVASTFPP